MDLASTGSVRLVLLDLFDRQASETQSRSVIDLSGAALMAALMLNPSTKPFEKPPEKPSINRAAMPLIKLIKRLTKP